MQAYRHLQYSYSILVLFLSASCSSPKLNKHYSEAKFYNGDIAERPIVQTVMIDLSEYKITASKLYLFDSLIVVNNKLSDKCVNLFSVSSHQLIAEVGKKGTGENNLVSCWNLDYNDYAKTIWATDVTTNKMLQLPPVDAAIPQDTSLAIHFEKDITCYFPKWLNDSIIISPHFSNRKGRVLFMDKAGRVVRESDSLYITTDDKERPQTIVAQSFQSVLAIAPDRSKFVLADFYCDKLELFDDHGKLNKVIAGPEHFEPVYKVKKVYASKMMSLIKNKTKIGYVDVRADNNKIYALYSGRFASTKDFTSGNCIYVFNWKGEVEEKLTFDHDILSFDISSGSHIIYTLSPDRKIRYARI